jgi:hypothetical protein
MILHPTFADQIGIGYWPLLLVHPSLGDAIEIVFAVVQLFKYPNSIRFSTKVVACVIDRSPAKVISDWSRLGYFWLDFCNLKALSAFVQKQLSPQYKYKSTYPCF